MKFLVRVSIILSVATLVLLNTRQAHGQGGVGIRSSSAYTFGEHITFTTSLNFPIQMQKAALIIFDTTQALTYSEPVTFDQNGVSEFRFDTRQNLLRPFTTILWHYDLTLADGNTVQTPTMSMRYDDDRFPWQALEADGLRIHWYNGDAQFGVSALNAAQAGMQNIRNLFTPDLSQAVEVFIYTSESDLRGTLYGAENWVAGHADSPAGVLTVMIEPGDRQNILMEQRIPHELMHVMLYRQVGAGYRNIPAWLREGMSMLAEVYPNPDYDTYLKEAAARNDLIPIKDLCASFSPYSTSAFLAYAQSRSFTHYLRGQFGTDGLLTLAGSYAKGVDCERGSERAFGVPLAKLERDWRTTVLGQNKFISLLDGFAPYLILLCLVSFTPLIGVIGSLRRKGDSHGR